MVFVVVAIIFLVSWLYVFNGAPNRSAEGVTANANDGDPSKPGVDAAAEVSVVDGPASVRDVDSPPLYVRTEEIFDRSQPAVTRADNWINDAEASPSMAYDVGTAIGSCAAFAVDDARVEATMAEGSQGAVKAAGLILEQQDFCVGLTKDHFDAALDLLERSASSGLVEAQVGYAAIAGNIIGSREEYRFDSQRIENYRRNSIAFLRQAVRQGNNESLANLSMIFSEGRLVQRDPDAALQYYREFLKRSGRNSERDLKYLQSLEAEARTAGN